MKALVHAGITGMEGLSFMDFEKAEPGKGEVRVRLKTAGMNHRDLIVLERHKGSEPPLVLGSDGAGIIDAVGEGVEDAKVGDEVIINPGLGWRENTDAPPQGFEILGHPFHGTFAEYVVIPSENALPKPAFLTWEEAGVLSLGALTAYRVLFTRAKLKEGMKILIPGIGGGVATLMLQMAKSVGAIVYVTSRSEEKRQAALEMGANQAFDSNGEWAEALGGKKMDVVIESVGAATFNKSLSQLRTGGTLVTFGASAGDTVELNLRAFFYGQFNLLGSTMGSGEELREMLSFIEEHNIRPVIDRMFPLKDYQAAFDKLNRAEQLGKIGFIID
ncbi:NAD(P)-dependent alcohol dehydrogenase [Neobacillus notoginsengisoli]|uniref:NAD(P)-dependent alcohol dehydrogenase n=1 Tax=Neobacillus notoginsengisoli TaxID=1578198 RepID=A0A417YX50_9BACI|nr:zinc-binding dehydrogenase [Neobacillus notoginsengisoli]RHW42173.1 NAD(P)-dependent alcohol dehydrogenase [Neobacillus notoginsengisoli]